MFNFGRAFELQREMERYLEGVGRGRRPIVVFSRSAWQPSVDVYETEESVVVVVDLAGVPQENIDLIVGRNSLLVRGERAAAAERGDRTYSCIEIPFGPFERTVEFATSVDPDKAAAACLGGFLEVVMPKAQPARARRVAVREG